MDKQINQPSTIILTGCAGFIGSHLLDRLLSEGHKVIGVDDFNNYYPPGQKHQNIAHNLHNPNFTLIKKDICQLAASDLPSSFGLCPSALIHLAARAGVRASIQQPLLYQKVNVGGTLKLLELAKELKVNKFIFGGSSSVYGNNTLVPFREDAPCDKPISPYAATKRSAELLCYSYHHLYKIPITILRFFTVYGPRNRPDMAMYKLMDAIAHQKQFNTFGKDTSRDYTFVDDIVDGIIRSLKLETGFKTINLGNSSPVSLDRLIKLMEKIIGKSAIIKHSPLPAGDVQTTYADISVAKKILNWSPKTDIFEGLTSLWKWYQEQNET